MTKTDVVAGDTERAKELLRLADMCDNDKDFEAIVKELDEVSKRLPPLQGYGLATLDGDIVMVIANKDKAHTVQNELLGNGVITFYREGAFSWKLFAHEDTPAERLVELTLRGIHAPNDYTQ